MTMDEQQRNTRIPRSVFISYAHEDEQYREQLEKHLSLLQRQGYITTWHDRRIVAGEEWASEIESHLNTAQIILLLISPDFMVSNYCYSTEMQQAMERHERGEACLIPIILRPVDWQGAPFEKLQALPINGKPLSSWRNRDRAFLDVAQGIRKTIENRRSLSGSEPTTVSIRYLPHERNPFFTGRKTVLAGLHKALMLGRATGSARPQALSGESGIGKTQIALEYAYRYKDEYQAVLWIRASSLEILKSDLVSIAEVLKLPEKNDLDQSRVVAAVKQWLHSHQNWLLILDSIVDKDLEEIYNFLLRGCRGDILLTTHTQNVANMANLSLIDPMDKEEGKALILRWANILKAKAPITRASNEDQTAAEAIVNEMGGLPLALEQAGAYIKETGCSLLRYLDIYREHHSEFLDHWGED